ncbi:DUF6777 domain-containing protein [Streptomyces jumonjinensis]|uniref:DUF6777 domain-containing protein n=1 Tax=Streptomyces jumonjinensis TaxID=1945 RepID=A0A646KER8_STRJU|nr:DUF6777 domain-containing protein [Streptomyces jumonjinensis]MQT00733.1 hypothetical protein [Streptomyces jumonjinensis]
MRAIRPRRSPVRDRRPARRGGGPVAFALCAGLVLAPVLAGCGGETARTADPEREVLLRAAGVPGPDPYTASTVRELSAPSPEPPAKGNGAGGPPLRGQTLRTLSGATPGLYGGIEAAGSCDAERQLTLLDRDGARARAFAQGAGVPRAGLPGFLRGLTPVVLRTDTRVTAHGYRDGVDAPQQAVLQAGSAVLVDRHGTPRVRCAGGNPLTRPVAAKGPVVNKGGAWAGYAPERVVVIRPADRVIGDLMIIDVADGSWIGRETGSDGERDSRPEVLPPAVTDEVYAYPPAGTPGPEESEEAAEAADSEGSAPAPADSAGEGGSGEVSPLAPATSGDAAVPPDGSDGSDGSPGLVDLPVGSPGGEELLLPGEDAGGRMGSGSGSGSGASDGGAAEPELLLPGDRGEPDTLVG